MTTKRVPAYSPHAEYATQVYPLNLKDAAKSPERLASLLAGRDKGRADQHKDLFVKLDYLKRAARRKHTVVQVAVNCRCSVLDVARSIDRHKKFIGLLGGDVLFVKPAEVPNAN
jgi:hypothetical protein